MKNKHQYGISLVEVVIGIGILIFVLSAGFIALRTMSVGSAGVTLSNQADFKLRNTGEIIRREAIDNFSTMEETDVDRSGPPDVPILSWKAEDRKIQILSTIGAIDPQTRTRPVTLTATWVEGEKTKTKVLEFAISQLRGKTEGGRVVVNAVNALSTNSPKDPVSKIRATAPGHELTTVTCDTDITGTCTLIGVRLGTVTVTLDGSTANHYFLKSGASPSAPGAPNNANTGTWTKNFNLANVDSKTIVTLSTAELYPPGIISGKLVDSTNGNPINNAIIAFRIKSNTGVIPGSARWSTNSLPDGTFSTALLPGQYSVHVIGNSDYVAVAQVNDYYANYRTFYQLNSNANLTFVDSNTDPLRKALRSIKRGSLQVQIRGITYNSAFSPTITGNIMTGNKTMEMDFLVEKHTSFNDADLVGFNFNSSMPYVEESPIRYAQKLYRFVMNANTTTLLDKITPNIVHKDYPMDDSFQYVAFEPKQQAIYPFTPVVVEPDPDFNNPRLLFKSGGSNGMNRVFKPDGTDPNTFRHPIYTNELTGNPSVKNIYLLEASAYSCLEGQILDQYGNPFSPTGLIFNNVYIHGADKGSGVLTHINLFDTTYIGNEQKYTALGGSPFLYKIPTSGICAVPPNLGGDETVVRYLGEGNYIADSKGFYVTFEGFTKINDGTGKAKINRVTSFSSDSFTIGFHVDGYLSSPSYTATYVSPGSGGATTIPNVSVGKRTVYYGESAPTIIPPAHSAASPFVLNIQIKNQDVHFKSYYLTVQDTDKWMFNWSYGAFPGPRFSYVDGNDRFEGPALSLVQIGTSGSITGRVVDQAGDPIVGAEVRFNPSGYNEIVGTTNGSGNFTFTGQKFLISQGTNYETWVKMDGYINSQKFAVEAWNAMDWALGDITMVKEPAPSGGGSGGL